MVLTPWSRHETSWLIVLLCNCGSDHFRGDLCLLSALLIDYSEIRAWPLVSLRPLEGSDLMGWWNYLLRDISLQDCDAVLPVANIWCHLPFKSKNQGGRAENVFFHIIPNNPLEKFLLPIYPQPWDGW